MCMHAECLFFKAHSQPVGIRSFDRNPRCTSSLCRVCAVFGSWFSQAAPDLILTTEPHVLDEDEEVEIDVGLQELSLDAATAADDGAILFDTNTALPMSSIGLVARTADSTIWKVCSWTFQLQLHELANDASRT